jgi:FkbM family methyltransferase
MQNSTGMLDALRKKVPQPVKQFVRSKVLPYDPRSPRSRTRILPERDVRDDPATRQDVIDSFRLLLGRIPPERGLRGWFDTVESTSMTVGELSGAIISSAEFRLRLQQIPGWADSGLTRVEVAGHPMFINSAEAWYGGVLESGKSYEPHVSWFLKENLRPGDTFVDVGASVGYFSLLLGLHVGDSGQVLAFEPGPQNRSPLLLNLFVNRIRSRVYTCALADFEGIYSYSPNGANGLVRAFDGNPDALAVVDLVQCMTLDSIVQGAPVHAMKIDVEGNEGRVLKGALSTLKQSQPAIVFEFAPPAIETLSDMSATELLKMLTESGYSFDILSKPDQVLTPRTPDELIAHYAEIEGDHFDVAAWPTAH